MNILMIARDTMYSSPGGDTVQVVSTAKYLEKLNILVTIKLSSEPINYQDFDLMHFFNIIRPDDILLHLKKTKLPFVVSTIFVDYSEYEKNNRKGLIGFFSKMFTGDKLEYMKAIARLLKNGDKIKSGYYLLKGHRASVISVARQASMLLPNSHNEYNRFNRIYKTNSPYRKIPNAIDVEIFNNGVENATLYNNHIICVGRIEGRKNQLNLIKALAGENLFLTIIGKPSPNHLGYYFECKKLVDEHLNMQIVEHIDQKELAGIYTAAKVHVLPSWFETTGLVSLEAGFMGCNVVVTTKGDTEEYFGDLAYYCEPDNITSIKDAVLKALNNNYNPDLKSLILAEYTWQKAAIETLAAYKKVLAN